MAKKNRGMTLAEIVIALAVLAILAVPLLSLLAQTSKDTVTTRDKTIALYIAQQEMETLDRTSITERTDNYRVDHNMTAYVEIKKYSNAVPDDKLYTVKISIRNVNDVILVRDLTNVVKSS